MCLEYLHKNGILLKKNNLINSMLTLILMLGDNMKNRTDATIFHMAI